MSQFKTYLFDYPYQGGRWSFEIKAASKEDAEARVRALGWAKYEGEAVLKIPVPMDGWIKWNGLGECPLSKDQRFDAKFEDGFIYEDYAAWEWDFIMDEGEGDPVPIAYRIRPHGRM